MGGVGGLLVDDELEGAGEHGLHGGDVDFAVALAGVAVTGFEECAFGVDGDVESGAGYHLFVVDVAGVHPGAERRLYSCRERRGRCPCCRRRGGGGCRRRGRSGRSFFGGRGGLGGSGCRGSHWGGSRGRRRRSCRPRGRRCRWPGYGLRGRRRVRLRRWRRGR